MNVSDQYIHYILLMIHIVQLYDLIWDNFSNYNVLFLDTETFIRDLYTNADFKITKN